MQWRVASDKGDVFIEMRDDRGQSIRIPADEIHEMSRQASLIQYREPGKQHDHEVER